MPSSDLSHLYDPRPHRRSCFRHVYAWRSRWQAQVRIDNELLAIGSAAT